MACKKFRIDEDTVVTVYKRRTNRSIRLTLASDGSIKVTVPLWTPYYAGVRFAQSRLQWIKDNRPRSQPLVDGQSIGKAHRLRFQISSAATKPVTRVRAGEVLVQHAPDFSPEDSVVQEAAQRAGIRALRQQAEQLLPQRLDQLAAQYGFTYGAVTVKQMKSRWGSCDRNRNIVLNVFLMQLPWEHIDYVILHELTHTDILRHGPDFWQAMERILPNVKETRKAVREHRPLLQGLPQSVA